MSRQLLTFDLAGMRLCGTAHLPHADQPRRRLGAILLNAGPAPRAGNSDLSVRMADALALEGFPSFRFDMPGLGDSPGDVPAEVETFWQQVLVGRNDRPALSLLKELRQRYDLDGLIVGGLCAGSVTAVRAAALDDSDIAGLLLLEPNFRLASEIDPAAEQAAMQATQVSPTRRRLMRGLSLKSWLYLLTGDNIAARLAAPLRPLLLETLKTTVGHELPRDTNVDMVLIWREVMRGRIPTLVLVASGRIEEAYCWRILDSIPPVVSQDVFVEGIPGTNHIFTAGNAREHAIRSTCAWACRQFPRQRTARAAVSVSKKPRAEAAPAA
jgi:pimeloyl-ACP methyl ester carboxylesterase